MDEPLHPSTLSEILDRTAQLYRSRFLVFLGIAAIPTVALLVPLVGLVAFAFWVRTHHGGSPETGIIAGLGIGLVAMVSVPIYVAATSLASAAMNHAGSRAVFGQLTSIRDAYRAVWRRGWRYVGIYLMEGIAVWVLPVGAWTLLVMISAMLAAVLSEAGAGGGALFGFLALLVVAGLIAYGIWMSIRLSLAFAATTVEQTGAWAAMRRSWTLTKGTRGRIFVLYLLCTALHWILSMVVFIPLILVLSLWPGANSPENAQLVGTVSVFVFYGAGFVIQAFTRPVYGIALVLFYYDQRIRHEGFDIEWMMLQAGLVAPTVATIEAQPWTQALEGMAGGTTPEVEPAIAQGAGAVVAEGATPEPTAEPAQETPSLVESAREATISDSGESV
jgi:hypothetical protein